MLRHVLYEKNQSQVTIGDELSFLESYIESMKLRMPLHVDLEVQIDGDYSSGGAHRALALYHFDRKRFQTRNIRDRTVFHPFRDGCPDSESVRCRIENSYFSEGRQRPQRWFSGSAENRVTESPESIWVTADYKQVRVPLDEILFVEGMKDYVQIRLEDGQTIVPKMNLKAMEEQLPADRFFRVHRSYIVQVSKVRTIERNCVLLGKTRIPVSDIFRYEFYRRIGHE